jgi:hypothetical protein
MANSFVRRATKDYRMLFGHNTNITIHDTVYHVQTEDRGIANALIDTTVYCRGRVLHRLTENYFDLLPLNPDHEAALKQRISDQHRDVMEQMRSGALHLTPPPAPNSTPEPAAQKSPELAPPKTPEQSLILLLANPNGWLNGKRAGLKVLVSNSAGLAVSGAKVTLHMEGAAVPFELSAATGSDGFALLEFDMPKLASAEPAIVIKADHSGAHGHLRFQLRAKPRVPAS